MSTTPPLPSPNPLPPSRAAPGTPVEAAAPGAPVRATGISVTQGARPAPEFRFDGGAATYFGTGVLALLITVLTLGFGYPFAVVLRERWKAKHTFVEGRRLKFTGTATGLFLRWVLWWVLTVVTLGIYGFWVIPRLTRWKVEHQKFAQAPVTVDVRMT